MNTTTSLFGPHVHIIDESCSIDDINQLGSSLFTQLEKAQFGSQRVALLFKPGHYQTDFNVGFYTQVAGLGLKPTDTVLSKLTVNAQWLGRGNATCNFWRSVENLTLDSDTTWAVSQAAPMRRLQVNGNLALHDKGYASGGFLADSVITGNVDSGPQQQWISRNDRWGSWTGWNWNMMFMGVNDQCPDPTQHTKTAGQWPVVPYTFIDEVPIVREKPFLVWHNNAYFVYVPSYRLQSKDVSWLAPVDEGTLLPLDHFYIVKEDVDLTPEHANHALASGKHLLITPGVYHWDTRLHVIHSGSIVLGLGYASLVATAGHRCIEVNDGEGMIIAGLLLDAGETTSVELMRVGQPGTTYQSHNPILLSDLFFRVGGTPTPHPTRAETCLVIHSHRVIGDHFWIWRADHGTFSKWGENDAMTGLIVNGNDVTIYGLFVEHFQGYNTIWNGERGRVYFYQNEIPYDVPYQTNWMSHEGTKCGYAQYKVSDHVKNHVAVGLGIYGVFLHNLEKLELTSAIEAPVGEGIRIENAMTMMIVEKGKNPPASAGTIIRYIVNNRGPIASSHSRLHRLVR